MVAKPTGVISATRKLNSQADPVLIEVMGTRWLKGAISDAYKKVRPRKPVGKKSENMKMKAPVAVRTCHQPWNSSRKPHGRPHERFSAVNSEQ